MCEDVGWEKRVEMIWCGVHPYMRMKYSSVLQNGRQEVVYSNGLCRSELHVELLVELVLVKVLLIVDPAALQMSASYAIKCMF